MKTSKRQCYAPLSLSSSHLGPRGCCILGCCQLGLSQTHRVALVKQTEATGAQRCSEVLSQQVGGRRGRGGAQSHSELGQGEQELGQSEQELGQGEQDSPQLYSVLWELASDLCYSELAWMQDAPLPLLYSVP